MTLLRLENATLAFSHIPLLDKIDLSIEAGEKIFIVGRNGMGKSSLLKIISGEYKLDDGKLHTDPNIKISQLPQDLPDCNETTVYEYVANGLYGLGELLNRYHELTSTNITVHDQAWMNELELTQKKIEQQHGWQYEQIVNTVLTQLELSADKKIGELSGGWKRRASLARAMVCNPDILLLDEPTNHLDLEGIQWLEDFLNNYQGVVLCITHDRALLKKLSNRILELDRGHLVSYQGNYESFLRDKEHRLEVEARQAREFDKLLAKEEAWIRQGIKARRTRNEGRVRALHELRKKRSERRVLQSGPSFTSNQDKSSGNLVIEAKNISFNYEANNLVDDFSTTITRGDKIGLIGPNGVGKSTLLKMLLGDLEPLSGTVKLGTNLQIAYFDQMRAGIDSKITAFDNVGGGRDTITINGKDKHVISYLSDFLFTPERARLPVRMLSGGECNRLLLAKLFSLPSNFLVLDEPTNDLDIESLELLEEVLGNYQGTLLLVSHDREFVDNVVTSTMVFRGNGLIEEYVGGYSDIPTKKELKIKNSKVVVEKPQKPESQLTKITNKITKLESQKEKIHTKMLEPEFYESSKDEQQKLVEQLSAIDVELSELFKQWEELESSI